MVSFTRPSSPLFFSRGGARRGRPGYEATGRDFLFDVHFVDLENFQPLARFKVQKFAEVTKFVLGLQQEVSVSIV